MICEATLGFKDRYTGETYTTVRFEAENIEEAKEKAS